MARMIPPVPAVETPDSERRVYERFQSELPDTWTVVHSQRFLLPASRPDRSASRRGPQEGEIDFLVLDPSRGAIGFEVKGGGVRRTADGWSSVDRHRTTHQIKDPGKQASSGVHAIRRYLEDAPGFGGRGFRCRFAWGVVLPDVECPVDMGPDLPRDVVLDRGDFAGSRLRQAVDRAFDRHCGAGQRLSEEGAEAFVAALVERFPPASRLALRFREEDRDMLRLTEDQMLILDNLAAHDRAAIAGSAGTGKTVLAQEKARRLATTGKRVLLLCFNLPLAEELSAGARDFDVETFHAFCRQLALRAGLPFESPRPGRDKDKRFWAEEAPVLLLDALQQLPAEARYDAIVVDEAQDFLPDWWPCLDEALRRNRDGTLYAFYDDNQNIYGGGPPGALQVIETRLVYNCRNTACIAGYAARQVGAEPRVKAGAPQGEPVEEVTCRGDAEVVQAVAERLDRLVFRENVDPDAIAVVSTRTLKNSPFASDHRAGRFELVNLGNRGRKSDPASPARQVVFDTLHRFKGLERDVVILLDLPGGDRDAAGRGSSSAGPRGDLLDVDARQRYVAASRAKHLLVVVRLRPEPPA